MWALITGGSRGIGRAAAKRLAADGFNIIITYRQEKEKAEVVVAACRKEGVEAKAYPLDLNAPDEIDRLKLQVEEECGPVVVLVNNAGLNRDGLALRMSYEQFSSVVNANLTGTFLVCKAFLPGMISKRRGRIINIASVAGLYGNAGQANYAAAKAGIIGLSRTLAKEVGKRQVTVNVVAPGFITTDMTKALPEALSAKALDAIALGRFGTPEDVAGLISYLAGPDSAYLTGQVIEISGGLVI